MSLKIETARLVKKLRKEYGITQEELAFRSGISIDSIRRLETGKHLTRLDNLFQLTDAFNNDPDALLLSLYRFWQENKD